MPSQPPTWCSAGEGAGVAASGPLGELAEAVLAASATGRGPGRPGGWRRRAARAARSRSPSSRRGRSRTVGPAGRRSCGRARRPSRGGRAAAGRRRRRRRRPRPRRTRTSMSARSGSTGSISAMAARLASLSSATGRSARPPARAAPPRAAATGTSRQPRLGAREHRPAPGVDQAGDADRHAGGRHALRPRPRRDVARSRVGELVEHLVLLEPAGVEAAPGLGDHLAGQVEREGGHVVDVDLGADAADAVGRPARRRCPGRPTAPRSAGAVTDQAAAPRARRPGWTRRPCQPELGGQPGAGPRPVVAHGPQHQAEVGPPQRRLVGGRRVSPRAGWWLRARRPQGLG